MSHVPRAATHALAGATLALGAPLGLVALRALGRGTCRLPG